MSLVSFRFTSFFFVATFSVVLVVDHDTVCGVRSSFHGSVRMIYHAPPEKDSPMSVACPVPVPGVCGGRGNDNNMNGTTTTTTRRGQ